MPFCTNCGNQVRENASFCQTCGTAQPRSPAAREFLAGISDRTACILCYIPVFGVIPSILFLAAHRYRTNHRVRFDAFQSIYLFVGWLIVSAALPTFFIAGFPGFFFEHLALRLLRAAAYVCWIYLLLRAAQERQVRVPIVGDLAARSAAEQQL